MKRYIPSNVDIDMLLTKLPSGIKGKADALIYILNLISEIPAKNKTAYSDGFTHLSSGILQQYVRRYNVYLEMLLKEGILETDNRFIKGEKARGYRFTEIYQTPLREIIVEDKIIRKKLRPKKHFSKQHQHLSKWFNSQLHINSSLAKNELFFTRLDSGKTKDEMPHSSLEYQINQFNADSFYFFKDSVGNRVHTSLSIKKTLRPFIKYGDQQLVSADISNSQPFMSLLLFNENFYEKTGDSLSLEKLFPSLYKELMEPSTTSSSLPPLTLGVLSKTNTGRDVEIYKELVQKGKLYEYIGEYFKINLGDNIKDLIFMVLYSSNKFYGQEQALPKRIFKSLFPTVYNLFSLIKSKQKNSLAVLLQKIEAEIILNRATKRIAMERPELAIYTLHDCIVTTLGNELYVDTVIKEVCLEAIGCAPTTKIEPWVLGGNYLEAEFLMNQDITRWLNQK